MYVYRTLSGQTVELSTLTVDLSSYVRDLWRKAEAVKQCKAGARPASAEFVTYARSELARLYPSFAEQQQVLNGPAGAIFRDGFYRLYAAELDPDRRQRFLSRLRFSVARVVHECFLDGGGSQGNFARAANLDRGSVSTLFRSLLQPAGEPDSASPDPRVSLPRFEEACRLLGIVPQWSYVEDDDESPSVDAPAFGSRSGALTSREAQLAAIIGTVAALLHVGRGGASERAAHDERTVDCKRVLAFYIAWLYRARNIGAIHRLVDRIVDAINTRPAFVRIADALGRSEQGLLERFQFEPLEIGSPVPLPKDVYDLLDGIASGERQFTGVVSPGAEPLPDSLLQELSASWSAAARIASMAYPAKAVARADDQSTGGAGHVSGTSFRPFRLSQDWRNDSLASGWKVDSRQARAARERPVAHAHREGSSGTTADSRAS